MCGKPRGPGRLWAPWRMEYIRSPAPHQCVFCEAVAADDDAAKLVLARGATCYVMMNLYPYNNGHLLIAPYEHVAELRDLEPCVLEELMRLSALSVDILSSHMHPDGFNLGMNLGRSAGAGIEEHLHMHLVPRWNGDTSYITVCSDTKVIVQHLQETYRELRPLFDERLGAS